MMHTWMKWLLLGISLLIFYPSFSQTQVCPVNINFSTGTLTNWGAYTGNNQQGNGPTRIKQTYATTVGAPNGTLNVSSISEYNLASVPGIQVKTTAGTDYFGGFSTIPTINGYQYNYSILLGSTTISRASGQNSPAPGGFIRGVSYKISVPPGPVTEPYTMTYAYAMVLENGRHNSDEQPLISATLTTSAGVITCASPSYYLPTLNDATQGGGGATLDTATALANGFSLSPQLSPNANPNGNGPNAPHLQDVWTKAWTEVTFDLSPYRGQQVTLSFEADNCVPGGHFAYGYIALRNTCAGLQISGDTIACTNSTLTYSIPALAGASYQWTVPPGWTITSGATTSNIITVNVGTQGGTVIATEQNSCANLKDTIAVVTTPPTIPGNVTSDAVVCTGTNSTPLLLSGNRGSVVKWIASTDSVNWSSIPDFTGNYIAQNLTTTTLFKAIVQNGPSCVADTSTGALITVNQKSVGGSLSPDHIDICAGQPIGGVFSLTGNTGTVVDWQSSTDTTNWNNFVPAKTDSSFLITGGIGASTQYRTIVENGVCPADTSSIAYLGLYNTPYPQSVSEPADTTICYGSNAQLNALITIGTSYTWTNYDSLSTPPNGNVAATPFAVNTKVSPTKTTNYLLNISNTGCPNILTDTFHINVIPPIIVNAGNDTAVVINEPLQLQATSSDTSENFYAWSPTTGLDNPGLSNPIAVLGSNIDSVRYVVTVTDAYGCFGVADILVKVFKTAPDIFVPNAFTPGKASNNLFRPVPVGVSSLAFFRVYNRWGQLVYSTSRIGDGWDGTLGGKPQDTGSFVWMVQGTSYTGKVIFKKGTMTLVR